MVNSRIVHLNDASFEEFVLKGKRAVLVDFWAPWCGPCHAVAPVVERLAQRFEGRVGVGKVDVDENEDIARRYGIRSIPTLMVFKGGAPMERIVGAASDEQIAAMLERHLDRDDRQTTAAELSSAR